ncbi:uncharacterized protein LOC143292427 [Babylonia areolata]|uniref:uncharacterized protein LOC143292427 n=1 Tax=Babylonia areolata TaxID=304850 RepID=UPI003FD57133
MWWPSPMDQACLEVKEEKKGRRTPSPKRHSAWGLEELLATAAPVRQTEDRNAAAAVGSDDDVHTKVPTLTTTTTTTQRADVIMVDADITSHVDRSTVTTIRSDGEEDEEGSCQSKESSSSYFFDLLNIHSAI